MDKYLPSTKCIICDQALSETGGKRIIACQHQGVTIVQKKGSNHISSKYPRRSYPLNEKKILYMVIWGDIWTDELIQKGLQIFQNKQHPWFCQKCSKHVCYECGTPSNYPMGSDIVDQYGVKYHFGIMPVDIGCINPKCTKYHKLPAN